MEGCFASAIVSSFSVKIEKTFKIDPVLWAFSEETDREVRKLSACFPFYTVNGHAL